MFDGSVYYCWSCDAHCRAVENPTTGACCPRCREHLSEDSRLDGGPRTLSVLSIGDTNHKAPAAKTSPGLWPARAAAMH